MSRFIIEGGRKLKGKIKVSGNKNAILPCLSACLLTEEEVILRNVPEILDVQVFLQILKKIGVQVKSEEGVVRLKAIQIKTTTLPQDLTSQLRASVLLSGPLLARMGKVTFSHPGGDVIGKRSIEPHLEGLKDLGCDIEVGEREYQISRSKNFVLEKEIFLEEASVTATENLILASVVGESKLILKNCAKEPHIIDLCQLLIGMGARLEGVGQSTLVIDQVKALHGGDFTVSSDYIEMATYAIAACLTGGEVEIENITLEGLEPVFLPLRKMGVALENGSKGSVVASTKGLQAIPKLTVNIWPGFPTDLMSVFIVLATQAKGVSLMHDWMYESRMFFADKLLGMGANITIADPHRVLVYGPTKLKARELETPDIRAGMALVLAALIAKGESVINRADLIERGYEDVVGKLSLLGAKIKKVS